MFICIWFTSFLEQAAKKKEKLEEEMKQLEGKLSEINREYGKIKLFLDQKGYSRARRMNTVISLKKEVSACLSDSEFSIQC